MSVQTQIVLLAARLSMGENTREICPVCDGGSTREKSLSITMFEDGIKWKCFRASCGVKGTTMPEDNLCDIPVTTTMVKKSTFEGHTKKLSEFHLQKIETLWSITNPDFWYWTPEYGGRIAMSIRSPKYRHRGWVLRDIRGMARQKALNFINEGEQGLSWYRRHKKGPTVVVEDIPSAVRAEKYMNSVALLGTGIGPDRALEIADYATRPVILALDQDATALSYQMGDMWKLLWDEVKVLPLRRDLKNETEDNLRRILYYE